jgi:16S rRNA processing protein RimM
VSTEARVTRRLVPIAYVARAHGLRGELRLHVHNEETEALRRGVRVVLRSPAGDEREVRLATLRPVDKAFLATVEGVADRDAAEALKGYEILVPRDELPPPEEGEFYACDIEGARAELEDGTLVGTVKALRSYPTCDVLVVERSGGGELEVPLVDDYVLDVDPVASVVKLRQIDEL